MAALSPKKKYFQGFLNKFVRLLKERFENEFDEIQQKMEKRKSFLLRLRPAIFGGLVLLLGVT
jgi:hypothetical protein